MNSLVLTRDGTQAISASEDRTLRVWDVETGCCVMVVPFDGTPTSIALAPDDVTAIVGDSSGNLCGLRLVREMGQKKGSAT